MLSQRETESTAERRLGITTWRTVDLESKQAKTGQTVEAKRQQCMNVHSFFETFLSFFVCAFLCNASRRHSDANPIPAELWRGWSIQGDRGRVSSSPRRGKEQTGQQKNTNQNYAEFLYLLGDVSLERIESKNQVTRCFSLLWGLSR